MNKRKIELKNKTIKEERKKKNQRRKGKIIE